jgi:hypothetical protein
VLGSGELVCHGPSVNGHGPLVCAGGGGAYMGLGLHVANMGVAVPGHLDTIRCRDSSRRKKFSTFMCDARRLGLGLQR